MPNAAETDEDSNNGQPKDPFEASHVGVPTADESTSAPENWVRLAELVEVEKDPIKLLELAQQLIAEIDKGRLQKSLPTVEAAAEGSDSAD